MNEIIKNQTWEDIGELFNKDIDYLTDSIICDCRDFADKYNYEFDFVVKETCRVLHKKFKKYEVEE